jgi:hypothetical protein
MARHRRLSSPQSLVLIVMLIAAPPQISRAHAQQPGPPQAPETHAIEPAAPKAPANSVAQPGKAPDAAPKPVQAGEGIPAVVVDGGQVLGVLGKQVRSSTGEDMGRIVDVIIDRSARVRAAVIDFGGFLGVGNRQIAVAWSAIRLPAQDKPGALVVDFTRDQLRVAPAYKAGEQVVLLGLPEAPAAAPAAPKNGATDKEAPRKEPPSK